MTMEEILIVSVLEFKIILFLEYKLGDCFTGEGSG